MKHQVRATKPAVLHDPRPFPSHAHSSLPYHLELNDWTIMQREDYREGNK